MTAGVIHKSHCIPCNLPMWYWVTQWLSYIKLWNYKFFCLQSSLHQHISIDEVVGGPTVEENGHPLSYYHSMNLEEEIFWGFREGSKCKVLVVVFSPSMWSTKFSKNFNSSWLWIFIWHHLYMVHLSFTQASMSESPQFSTRETRLLSHEYILHPIHLAQFWG